MDLENAVLFNEIPAQVHFFGEIILNRPQALNALTFTMCERMFQQLTEWKNNPKIIGVIIKSNSERAFCAGGDVRHFYEHRDLPLEKLLSFFKQEYALDSAVFHFPKPYISFLNGITMGGGAGISIPGSFRVATERLIFAMPETAIGFFPDVGAGYFLTRCPGKMGWYLGLTGNKINAADTYALGLTNFFISSQDLHHLEQKILTTDLTTKPAIKLQEIMSAYKTPDLKSELILHRHLIDDCFSQPTIEAIMEKLNSYTNPFAKKTLETLQSRSPTSLKITLEHLNRAIHLSFDDVIQHDLELAAQFLKGHDFYEGVRAVLIDKDNSPRWSGSNL